MHYLFIVGCGHSGTSLMLSYFAATEEAITIKHETSFLLKHSLHAFKDACLKNYGETNRLIVEKTPRHVYKLPEIRQDSECSAIVMLRNPVDTVASLCKRGISLNNAIHRYASDNAAWLQFVNDQSLILVKYEDLVAHEYHTLKYLSKRVGIDLTGSSQKRVDNNEMFFGCSDAKETDGKGEQNHLLLRNWQVRQPLTNQNGRWRERLNAEELNKIQTNLAPLIEALGYQETLSYTLY